MSEPIYNHLHEALLKTQRKLRWLRLNTPSELDPKASLILPSLASRPDMFSKDLAEFLVLDKSGVSRLLAQFQEEELIFLRQASGDRRQKEIVFTELGRKLVKDAVKLNQHFAKVGMAPLTEKERDELGYFYKSLANGLGVREEKALAGEEIYTTEQKRLARAMGMVGHNYMDTGYDISAYQMLFALNACGGLQRFSMLCDILPTDRSTATRQMMRFVEAKLLIKKSSTTNKREILVEMSFEGKRTFKKFQDGISERLKNALEDERVGNIERGIELLEKALAKQLPSVEDSFNVVRATTQDDYALARSFYVEQVVKSNRHGELTGKLIPDDSICFMLLLEGHPTALAVIEENDQKFLLTNLEFSYGMTKSSKQRKFIQAVIEELKKITRIKKLTPTEDLHQRFDPEFRFLGI